jgi:hypothetical protein
MNSAETAETEMVPQSPGKDSVITDGELLTLETFKKTQTTKLKESTRKQTTTTTTTTVPAEFAMKHVIDTTNESHAKEEQGLSITLDVTTQDTNLADDRKVPFTTLTVEGRRPKLNWDEPSQATITTTTTMMMMSSDVSAVNRSVTAANKTKRSHNQDNAPSLQKVTCVVGAELTTNHHNTTGVEVGIAALSPSLQFPLGTIHPFVANIADQTKGEPEILNYQHYQQQQQQQLVVSNEQGNKNPLSVISLPNDALHSIASFLTPLDWANFGLCDKRTNQVCRTVFRRVRLHGFRCATEVITAWVGRCRCRYI